ncbi:15228_t:CDS:2 [Acaulospora colombiana]|uniref:15228_t:CDS:1 n=1 Tax=Acaulospora colombiana TaxID=27376 RepID=A0ACA9K6T9_9GLOM|nr:15228_t:CDS:2 [Acaulospora colombiana]
MSSIEKLQILGIRSFSPITPVVMRFQTPLTVIVGPNGAGKTTIIECLKYATTGDMPTGTRIGGAFVHDPRLIQEHEVKGQVKLKLTSIKNVKLLVARSLQVKVTGVKVTCTTLEALLSTEDPETKERVSITTRCADLDNEIPLHLGVSKAILDNVIFCHQEESNWPMSEPSVLKKKFDEIFSATRYTKALANIADLRKHQAQLLREDKIMLEQFKREKDRADNIEITLEDDQRKADEIKTKRDTLDEQIDKNGKEIEELVITVREYDKIKTEVEVLQRERQVMVSTKDELVDNMREMHESDEELMRIKDEYRGRLTLHQGEKQTILIQKNQILPELQKLSASLNESLIEKGRLEAEQSVNEKMIEELEKLVREISRTYQFRTLTAAPLTNQNLQKFKISFQDEINEKDRLFIRQREQSQQKEDELNAQLNRLNSEINSLKHLRQSSKSTVDSKRQKKIRLVEELGSQKVSEADVSILSNQLDEEEASLKKLKSSIENDETSKKCMSRLNDLRDVDHKISNIDEEISSVTHQASARARLDLQRSNRLEKTNELQSLLTSHRDDFSNILGQEPCIDTLDQDMQKILRSKEHELRQMESEDEKIKRELSNIDGRLQMLQSTRQKKLQENHESRQQLSEVCGDRDLPDVIKKVEEELTDLRDLHSSFANHADLYKTFIGVSQKKHNCPLCHRAFGSMEELSKFQQKLQEYISDKIPDKLSTAGSDILDAEARLSRLRNLQSAWITINNLQSQIPELDRQIEELQDEKVGMESILEDVYLNVVGIKSEIDHMKKLGKDVENIARLYKEITAIDTDINNLQQELSLSGSTKSLDDLTGERDLLQIEARRIRRDIDNLNKVKDVRSLELTTRQDKVHRLYFQLQEQKNNLAARSRMQNDINELDEEIRTQENSIRTLDSKMSELSPKIRVIEEELRNFRQKKIDAENSSMRDLNEMKKFFERFCEIERAIETYNSNHGEQKLASCMERIEKINQQITEKKLSMGRLEKQIQFLEKETSEIREVERDISDNLRYRQCQGRLNDLDTQIAQLNDKIQTLGTSSNYRERLGELQRIQSNFLSNKATLDGEIKQLEETIRRATFQLNTEYKNAKEKYREKFIEVKTSEMGIKDLEKYWKALDNAIMHYHSLKMEEINSIIAELWIETYRGSDIDYIEIRSDVEQVRANRSYNYRVVMIKNGVPVDMRGRCSAGQKNLASILIRLALAETFCLNCGVFVLDEPTTNLDDEHILNLASSLRHILESRRRQRNFQLIVITHDQNFSRMLGESEFSDKYIRVMKNEEGYSTAEDFMEETIILYSPDYEKDQYKLIELPPEVAKMYDDALVQEATAELPSLCIKATSLDGEPVLCTRNKTFVMRKQHYSDSLLILAPSVPDIDKSKDSSHPQHANENEDSMDVDEDNEDGMGGIDRIPIKDNPSSSRGLEVIDTLGYLCELTLSAPKIEQLDELLSTTPYKGQEHEMKYITVSVDVVDSFDELLDKMKFYTFEELEDVVQASVEELRHSLGKRYALEIEGHWRYIDSEYMGEVAKSCIMFADVYDIDIDHVSLKELCDIGKQYGFPEFIVEHVFTCLSESIDHTNESGPIFKLSKERIVRFFGIQLLKKNEKNEVNSTFAEFLSEWRKEIPIEHPVSFELISVG